MEQHKLERIIEAILFASDRALSIDQIRKALPDVRPSYIRNAIDALRKHYDQNERGITIEELGGGYRMLTRAMYNEWVKVMYAERRNMSLSPASLETLSVIALKEPIVASEVERIRGVNADGVIRNLLRLKLIKALGRKDVIGRPILYGVGESFYDHFGLRDRRHLFELVQNLSPEEESESYATEEEPPIIVGPDEPEEV